MTLLKALYLMGLVVTATAVSLLGAVVLVSYFTGEPLPW